MKINLTKSKLIPVGRVEDLEELAFEVGCKVGVLPTTYLGRLDEVEKRFHKRLAIWKRQYISKGGRPMLISSMLASLPIYFG